FVAPSHYLLGVIEWRDKHNAAGALSQLNEAIAYDTEYSAPYYQKAIIEVEKQEVDVGLKDLDQSTTLPMGGIQCVDLNTANEIKDVWSKVQSSAKFQEIQESCRTRYGLPHIAPDVSPRAD